MTGSGALDARSVRRRFVLLSGLTYLRLGFTLPVLVLLLQERGLTLAQVGLVLATQAGVVMALELPTGGLADALGRRPVLLAAAALDVVALVLLALAGSPAAFAVAAGLQGVHTALDSGPLEAWFVDASRAADPDAPVVRGLARAATAVGIAIAAGALAATGLVAWGPVAGVEPLVLPVVAAVAVRLVHAAALVRWLDEPRRPIPGVTAGAGGQGVVGRGAVDRAWVALAAGARATPGVIASTLRLLRASPPLAALVAVEMSWGAGLVAVEVMAAPRLVELVGDPDRGAAVFGVAVAAGWTASALGAGATGPLARIVGSPARVGAALRIAQGAGALALAAAGGPAGLVAGYLGFYVVHGAANVVHYGMVHELVDASRRTTVLSAHSLAARGSGALAAVGLGRLATAAGPATALAVAAVLLAAAAPLYAIAGRASRPVGGDASGPPRDDGSDEAGDAGDAGEVAPAGRPPAAVAPPAG